MTLLTVFTSPKPFTDPHIDLIQRNALRSWLALGDVEVFVVGDEYGAAVVASEYGAGHLGDVDRNESGTPLVNSIFALAQQAASSPLLAYVNADILLLPDFVEASRQVMAQADRFLLVGQRRDLDVTSPLDFTPGWPERLRAEAQERGTLHPPAGSDYFIFPRGQFVDIPSFAIGRAGWDNWMIYHAVQQPWPVIDATPSIVVVHQNHDYSHLPNGEAHYDLEETTRNAELGGGMRHMYMVLDTDKEFRGGRIRPPRFRLIRLIRRLERLLQPAGEVGTGLRWFLTRRLRHWRRAIVGSRA